MTQLIHLIYSSAAAYKFSEDDLIDLLTKARQYNGNTDVTGMLLYTEGSFFQILEGEESVVDALFAKISKDKRHTKAVTIMRKTIPNRSFGEWTMGYANVTSEEVEQLTGMNDFFTYASCLGELDKGRAKRILSACKEGLWRKKVRNLEHSPRASSIVEQPPTERNPNISFVFQLIIDANLSSIISFEAMMAVGTNLPSIHHTKCQL